MLPLPAHILACPGSVELILHALRGELPQTNLYDAWDALPDPNGYKPTEEVRIWLHLNWREIMPAAPTGQEQAADSPELSCAQIPTVPTVLAIARAPLLSEPWMKPFLEEYVQNGGVVIQAAKAGPIHRDTVYQYLKHDPEFARAFQEAEEERKGLIRSTIKRRAIDGWEEPVFGRVGKDQDGIVGYIRKHDNRVLIRWAEACLEEFAKKGDGTTVNVNASATANAEASANSGIVVSHEKLLALQARTRRALEKQVERARAQGHTGRQEQGEAVSFHSTPDRVAG